jgi:hypothetical protein
LISPDVSIVEVGGREEIVQGIDAEGSVFAEGTVMLVINVLKPSA